MFDYDIIIKWVDRFEKETSDEGVAGVEIHEVGDDGKWNTGILLAVHTPKSYYSRGIKFYDTYEVVSTRNMYDIARHELGHAFGLGHSFRLR